MSKVETRTAIQAAAERLREIALDSEDGAFISSEEALVSQLGCSRSTVRQVARLLEREGLLRVRRGINGGYFSARPDAGTIEATVSAYLETLDMNPQDVTMVASVLWVEAMRRAAGADRDEVNKVVERLRPRYKSIKDTATFDSIRKLEVENQAEIFSLTKSNYVKLIFDINATFSRRNFSTPIHDDESPEHREFVRRWRDAKLMELSALAEGDPELAVIASQHARKIWFQRVWSRFSHPA